MSERSPDEDLGFVVDIIDQDPDLDGVAHGSSVDIQVKPSPSGYQVDLWWTDAETGERKQNSTHVRTEDPRDGA